MKVFLTRDDIERVLGGHQLCIFLKGEKVKIQLVSVVKSFYEIEIKLLQKKNKKDGN